MIGSTTHVAFTQMIGVLKVVTQGTPSLHAHYPRHVSYKLFLRDLAKEGGTEMNEQDEGTMT